MPGSSSMPFAVQANLINWLRTQDLVLQRWRDEVLACPDADVDLVERLEAHRAWLTWELDNIIGIA